jgi:hypothetical protein
MNKVLDLQLTLRESCNFKICPILFVLHSYFEHYKNKGVWSSNFTLKKLCTWDELIKRLNPKQKNKLCIFVNYLPSQPIYLLN